jgi:hypothetical protein
MGYEVLTAVVLKSSIFWDFMSCSPLKVNRHFGRTCRLPLQDRRINHAELCLPAAFALVYSFLILPSCRWRRCVPPKRRFTFNGVQWAISRKTELSTVNLCMHAHHTKNFHAEYDKWCNRGSREQASNPHSARWLKWKSFSLLFGR